MKLRWWIPTRNHFLGKNPPADVHSVLNGSFDLLDLSDGLWMLPWLHYDKPCAADRDHFAQGERNALTGDHERILVHLRSSWADLSADVRQGLELQYKFLIASIRIPSQTQTVSVPEWKCLFPGTELRSPVDLFTQIWPMSSVSNGLSICV